jgi:hypothetical protein
VCVTHTHTHTSPRGCRGGGGECCTHFSGSQRLLFAANTAQEDGTRRGVHEPCAVAYLSWKLDTRHKSSSSVASSVCRGHGRAVSSLRPSIASNVVALPCVPRLNTSTPQHLNTAGPSIPGCSPFTHPSVPFLFFSAPLLSSHATAMVPNQPTLSLTHSLTHTHTVTHTLTHSLITHPPPSFKGRDPETWLFADIITSISTGTIS